MEKESWVKEFEEYKKTLRCYRCGVLLSTVYKSVNYRAKFCPACSAIVNKARSSMYQNFKSGNIPPNPIKCAICGKEFNHNGTYPDGCTCKECSDKERERIRKRQYFYVRINKVSVNDFIDPALRDKTSKERMIIAADRFNLGSGVNITKLTPEEQIKRSKLETAWDALKEFLPDHHKNPSDVPPDPAERHFYTTINQETGTEYEVETRGGGFYSRTWK